MHFQIFHNSSKWWQPDECYDELVDPEAKSDHVEQDIQNVAINILKLRMKKNDFVSSFSLSKRGLRKRTLS